MPRQAPSGHELTVAMDAFQMSKSLALASGNYKYVPQSFHRPNRQWTPSIVRRSRRTLAPMSELFFSIVYGVAIFAASNVVSFPLGFVNGFLEARKRPLDPRTQFILELAEGGIEVLVIVAITIHLLRQQLETPYLVAVGAYGLAGVAGYITSVRIFKKSSIGFWVRGIPIAAFCIFVSAYVA